MRRRIALLVAVLTAAAVAITVSSAQSGQRNRTTSFGGTRPPSSTPATVS